jgi:Tol biopolymer transport system component
MLRTVWHMRALLIVLAALAFTGAVQAAASSPHVQHRDPVPSPDGRLIAYTSFVGHNKRGKLIVMRRDGTQVRTLATVGDGKPWWSADGKLIAYVDREIYVVSPTGGRTHRLSHEYSSSGGPTEGLSITGWLDARTIAFDVYDCCIVGGVAYWWEATVTLGGKQVDDDSNDQIICNISVTCDLPFDVPQTVSPDGSRVVTYSRGPDGVTTLTLGGTGLDPIELGAASLAIWAPDGRHLAWVEPGWKWMVANRDGGDRHALPSQPAWSSDGAAITFEANVDTTYQVWVADGDGGNARPLTHEATRVYGTVSPWSPDGHWLAYVVMSGRTVSTVVIARDGTRRHVLHRWSIPYTSEYHWDETWSSLRWEPGRASAVYYDSTACGGSAIYRVDAPTARVTRLTNPCSSPR